MCIKKGESGGKSQDMTGQFAIISLQFVLPSVISGIGTRSGLEPERAPNLSHHARRRNWLPSLLSKKPRFITFCTRSIPHLPQSLDTSTGCGKRELLLQNPHANFRDSHKSCNQSSIKSSCSTGMKPKWKIGTVSAKCDKRRKNASETLTMFSFMPKNDGKNSPNKSARNANSQTS